MLIFASPLRIKSWESHHVFANSYLTFKELSNLITVLWGFPRGSVVKNPPASAGDKGSNPGQEDALEWEMGTHCSILAWEIPRTKEPGR